jgi:hypothetical protein
LLSRIGTKNELDDARLNFIYESTRELIADLGAIVDRGEANVSTLPPPQSSVLCVPARGEADELAILMLTQVLQQSGYNVEVVPVGLVKERLTKTEDRLPDAIVISALPPIAISRIRLLSRKAREMYPGVKLVIGLWGPTDFKAMQRRLGAEASDYFVHTLAETELQLRMLGRESHPIWNRQIEMSKPMTGVTTDSRVDVNSGFFRATKPCY